MVAECPPGALGANIHCGMAGVVTEVGESSITVEAT
jgi:hypothetical protein